MLTKAVGLAVLAVNMRLIGMSQCGELFYFLEARQIRLGGCVGIRFFDCNLNLREFPVRFRIVKDSRKVHVT